MQNNICGIWYARYDTSVAKGFREKMEIGLPVYIFEWKYVYLDSFMCWKRWYKKYFGLTPPNGQKF